MDARADSDKAGANALESDAAGKRHEVGDAGLKIIDSEENRVFGDGVPESVRRRAGVELPCGGNRCLGRGVLGDD